MRILVVEDSSSVRAYARGILEDPTFARAYGGVEVVEASCGFEAMRFLPRGPYGIIVTDINMGDINGLELIAFVRKSELHKATPVIIISTQATPRDVERGLSLGANAFVAKPFSPEALKEACLRVSPPAKAS